jgi:hypothetical protein
MMLCFVPPRIEPTVMTAGSSGLIYRCCLSGKRQFRCLGLKTQALCDTTGHWVARLRRKRVAQRSEAAHTLSQTVDAFLL